MVIEKNGKIKAFSNSTEFLKWNDANCCNCTKDYDCDENGNNGVTKCDIEEAIAISAIDTGFIDKSIAERAGLVAGHGYGQTCKEICLV